MEKRATIRDIAEYAGVSVTTVAKALADKPKIGIETRKKILKIASEVGYIPNRSAMAMSRNVIKIGIIHAEEPAEFFKYLQEGIARGSQEFADFRVEIESRTFPKSSSDYEVKNHLQRYCGNPPDGIILMSSNSSESYLAELETLRSKNVPVLCMISEVDKYDAIGIVQLNTCIAGRMAADFLSLTLPVDAQVAIFCGYHEWSVHANCVKGFKLQIKDAQLKMIGVYDAYDDREVAYYLTKKVLSEYPELKGIYVCSYNSVGVCQYLDDYKLRGRVRVIGHDLYPALAEKLVGGTLTATLFQNQFDTGLRSVRYMYEYLAGLRKKKDCSFFVTPQLVMPSNLDCYTVYF